MPLSEKERLTTFGLGALLGCLLVAGLIGRRNSAKSEAEIMSEAPIPQWAQPLPDSIPELLRHGKILHFKKEVPVGGRTWILQYDKNYPLVEISEIQSDIDDFGSPTLFKFLAADRLVVQLNAGVRIKDLQTGLTPLGLHTREHFKKKGLVIVGLIDVGIGKLAEAREKVSALQQVMSVNFDPIESGHR
jgi:hypothetical protein